jgi:hypothetical protein
MTSQLVLQNHRLHPVVDQLFGILSDLAVKPWVLQRCPCLRDRPLLGAQPRKRGGDPQRPNVIPCRPGGLELAQFGFGRHCRGVVVGLDLSKPNPLGRKGSEYMEA